MERKKGTIVLVERTAKGGTTSLGTAIRFDEPQRLPVVPFTGEDDLHKPAPKVAYAEADGFPLWAGYEAIEFQDPHVVLSANRRRGRLRIYLCPKQGRTMQFAERLGLSLLNDGLSGDHTISADDANPENTRTNFPDLFQNRQ